MLVNSLLLTATAAISLLPGLVYTAPTTVYNEDGSVEIATNSTDDDGNVVKRWVYLDKFVGCDQTQKNDIVGSWQSMVEMGDAIGNKVNFDEKVARDYLGDPSRNKANQDNINAIINTVRTWTLGNVFGWKIKMRCDDPNRKARQVGAVFPDGCPAGALREDFEKCSSRCWASRWDEEQGKLIWKYGAMAYTQSYPSKLVGDMNWCPGWFAQDTCNSKASQWSRSPLTEQKYHMVNYQCREQSMVHELFHIDANWQRHAPGNGHIYDRQMVIKGETKAKKAYGPLYTKVLARWARNDVGHYVATNADNLAYYFLGKWLQEVFGVYPYLPITDQVPIKMVNPGKRDDGPVDPPSPPSPPTDNPWDTPDTWDPIRVVNGEVRLGDLNDLADALGVESNEEARTLYDHDPEDCLDFLAQDENDENPVCADSDEALELDASQELIPPVDPQSAPETTSQPLLNLTLRSP